MTRDEGEVGLVRHNASFRQPRMGWEGEVGTGVPRRLVPETDHERVHCNW